MPGTILTGANDQVQAKGGYAPTGRAAINAASGGANTVVAGVPGKVIRVLQYVITCKADVTIIWESSGGTVIGGPMDFAAKGGAAPPFSPIGHMDTLPGEDLVLFATAQVGGHLGYILV